MSVCTLLSGEQVHSRIPRQLSVVVQAAMRSMGPCGRTAVYTQGNRVVHTRNAIDIIRYFTGDSPEETLLRETFVAAQRDLHDGIARLAAMFDAALSAGYALIASGIHPTLLHRRVTALLPELAHHFAQVTTPFAVSDDILRTFDLDDATLPQLHHALAVAGAEGHIEVSARHRPGLQTMHIQGFITDVNALTQGPHLAMSHSYVLVINDILRDQTTLLNILEAFANSNKSLVIIARGLEGEIRKLLEVNRASGVLNVAVYQPQQAGSAAREMLTDSAVATGATLVCEELGHSLATLTPNMLGRAARCELQGTRLIFSQPEGDNYRIALRLDEIKRVIEKSRYLQLDRENLVRRHARLAGNWVEICVGESATDAGLFSKISRACSAIAMARVSGVIAGGGAGLAEIAKRIEAHPTCNPADRAACTLLTRALLAPQKALLENGCHSDVTETLSDPAAHAHQLLQIAVSLALQFMTIDAAVLRG